ncbi:MAG: xanthine dehydrogenase family protein molybdopterin-binding subunit [Deltaproteobacteria bacterium]|nr:xanthine dehydrogenase family protein molybdopterin-binding subunit [Deltaproteobacteria bacterium]
MKELMAPALSKLIGSSKGGYSFTRDKIVNSKTKKDISFSDAAKECFNRKIYLHAVGVWHGPKVHWDEEKGSGDAYFTYVYGCNAVELEIEAPAGRVRLLSAIGAHDCGRAINPQMVQGQIYGGMMMGMGQALTEEIIVKDGKIENLNYNKYKIARSTDVPDMQALIIENPDPAGPWGAKSIGEPVNELMAGAIANAVYYATGFRASKLPIKPEDILSGIKN